MFLHQKIHFKAVLGSIGLLLHVPAIMALISLVICFVFQEYYALMPFLATAVIGVALGQFLYRVFFKAHASHLWDAMIIASIGWLFISLIGALSIWWIANFCMTHDLTNSSVEDFSSVTNALFESFSGFTSTGLTMIKLPEDLPRTIQWWRSFMQWVGGLGLMVFVLSLTHLFKEGYQLYYAEAHTEKIGKNVTSTSQVIWGIYFLYTVFGVILSWSLECPSGNRSTTR